MPSRRHHPAIAVFRSIVLAQISQDVSLDTVTGMENPEVPLAEDVRFQGEELSHRDSPLADIGGKGRVKRSVDILAEQDPLTVAVQPDGDGTRCMARDVDAVEDLLAETEQLPRLPSGDGQRGSAGSRSHTSRPPF